eukprot:364585-Chlamydomonas_euryale.AAC.15
MLLAATWQLSGHATPCHAAHNDMAAMVPPAPCRWSGPTYISLVPVSALHVTCLPACRRAARLELYNARDLDRFMDLMADDVCVSDGESGAVLATSKADLRARCVGGVWVWGAHAESVGMGVGMGVR